nr:hypothetical protein CFP56_24405 [Quercus suber]
MSLCRHDKFDSSLVQPHCNCSSTLCGRNIRVCQGETVDLPCNLRTHAVFSQLIQDPDQHLSETDAKHDRHPEFPATSIASGICRFGRSIEDRYVLSVLCISRRSQVSRALLRQHAALLAFR